MIEKAEPEISEFLSSKNSASLRELTASFLRIGTTAFGDPQGTLP